MTENKCNTCGWPAPTLCVCESGDRYWYKIVPLAQQAQIERIRAQVARVWPGAGMSVSYTPYTENGEPGPQVLVGFSSHDRISLYGHKAVLDGLEALLDVYVAHGPVEGYDQSPDALAARAADRADWPIHVTDLAGKDEPSK